MSSILFVCSRNDSLSQLAEAICRERAPADWLIASAGPDPAAQVEPKTTETLRRNGLSVKSLKPKGFDEVPPREWDFVVFLGCVDIHDVRGKKFIMWPVLNSDGPSTSSHEELYDELNDRIGGLLQFIREMSLCS
ncbi:MAG: low molecular weight phosphatase family protein [Elusimicrobia bacterium]|nr:low molecular weight phosphatase family protein [Elusimicrobiota bacterium]